MNSEQPKPSSAETDPVTRGQQLARLVASDQEGESASAMRQFALWAAKNGVSGRVSDILLVEVPHLLAGDEKTRAELERENANLKHENKSLFDINQDLGAQNEAIFNENVRLRKKPWTTKLKDTFSNAASGIGELAPEGLKKTGDFLLSAAIALSYATLGPLAPVLHKTVRGEERFNAWRGNTHFGYTVAIGTIFTAFTLGMTASIDSKEASLHSVKNKVIEAAATLPACPSLSELKNEFKRYGERECGQTLVQGPFKSPIFGFDWESPGPVLVKKTITMEREQISGTAEKPQYMVCTRQSIEGLRPPTNEDSGAGLVRFTSIRQEPKCELQLG